MTNLSAVHAALSMFEGVKVTVFPEISCFYQANCFIMTSNVAVFFCELKCQFWILLDKTPCCVKVWCLIDAGLSNCYPLRVSRNTSMIGLNYFSTALLSTLPPFLQMLFSISLGLNTCAG